ncbi:hypothetical protein ABIC28_001382 [Rhodococcus sp. PvR044]|uniref:hypothetical protein n=1 Tax=unclassified Rhodococcus (in: high G+C Gram-positive bacteria) TaxID=192944 RepID=UPI000BD59C84|nr:MULTISPECIES: hypothetical protein [unclassified Rhodococcus (in: high G+C Gram-positive bacteria)]PTR44765.1 hypothetical protein C8K38_103262 [Rhodococcus sp. OK611]SNX90206.1 hypothetical protein SAMN05447004_104262 [Rhodococcus sp. OK270]
MTRHRERTHPAHERSGHGNGYLDPVPAGERGIDVPAILQGSRIPIGGYSTEVGGEPIRITVGRHCVDDDGTFVPEAGNIMIRFGVVDIAMRPCSAVRVVRLAAPVNLGPVYVYVPEAGATWSRYLVTAFFSGSGSMLEAPPNFDWRKYANVFGEFSVYRADGAQDQLTSVYRSMNRSFYHSYMDGRGRYWKLHVTPPPENSGLGEAFDATLGALSRRSAIRSNLRPIALEWLHGGIVKFTFQRIRTQRCFYLELEIPSVSQMRFGRFFLPGDMVLIREPDQFAAGLVSMLHERSAASRSLFGTECECVQGLV